MEIVEVERWFASCLGDFVALGRGDTDDGRRLLAYYGVPLLLSTDVASTLLSDEAQVLAFAQQQIGGMRSAGYDGSVELTSETVILNRSCALHRGQFSRVRSDGTQIGRLEATYLITDGSPHLGDHCALADVTRKRCTGACAVTRWRAKANRRRSGTAGVSTT